MSFRSNNHGATIDIDKNIIYICNKSTLFQIDVKSKCITTITNNIEMGDFPMLHF